jgi:hypothetical protein
MSTRYFKPTAVIAEVNNHGSVGIWHVDVGHIAAFGAPMPRTSGAWCHPTEKLHHERMRHLIADRFLACAGNTRRIERRDPHLGVIDVTGTVDAVRAEISKPQDAYETHVACGSTNLESLSLATQDAGAHADVGHWPSPQ